MTVVQIDIRRKIYAAKGKIPAPCVIENLQLTLNAHQFVCLLGKSGCGKTTLLNSIAGLDTDFEGSCVLEPHHLAPKIGYVFQNPRLLPWRTVRENIELVLDAQHSSAQIDALLDCMELTAVQHVYPERLSVGMSRRVAIIRAFAMNPDVLLMDEPFVSLDAPTTRQMRKLLIHLWQQRPHTVLFVTHDLREAIILADSLVFLSTAPMRIIQQIAVPIARENREDEACVEIFRQQLLQNYPNIQSLL